MVGAARSSALVVDRESGGVLVRGVVDFSVARSGAVLVDSVRSAASEVVLAGGGVDVDEPRCCKVVVTSVVVPHTAQSKT